MSLLLDLIISYKVSYIHDFHTFISCSYMCFMHSFVCHQFLFTLEGDVYYWYYTDFSSFWSWRLIHLTHFPRYLTSNFINISAQDQLLIYTLFLDQLWETNDKLNSMSEINCHREKSPKAIGSKLWRLDYKSEAFLIELIRLGFGGRQVNWINLNNNKFDHKLCHVQCHSHV